MQKQALGALAFVLVVSAVSAGEDEQSKDNKSKRIGAITIVGARLPSATFSELTTSTVIAPETFEMHSVGSTVDVVSLTPGVYVEQPGGRGSRSSLYLRGADPNATLILVDGIKINDPNNSLGGTYDLQLIDPSLIEQIEVVRGPGASIYGADALAGAINVHTKAGRPPDAVRVGVTAGADDMRGAHGHVSYSDDGHSGMLHGAYQDDGTPVEGSKFVNRSIAFSHRAAIRSASTLGVQIFANNNDSASFPDDSGGQRYASRRTLEQRSSEDMAANVSFEYAPSHRQEIKLALTMFTRDELTDSPGIAPGVRDPFGIPASTSDSELKRNGMVATVLNRYSGGHQSIIGAEVTTEEGDNRSAIAFGGTPVDSSFSLERASQALFFYGRFRALDNVIGELGLRADHVESADTEVNPSASLSWDFSPTTVLRVNWGRGFKLPSFYALGNPIVGNANLKSETSEMVDGGVVFKKVGVFDRIEFTAFRNTFENLVDFEAGPPPQLINRGEVKTQGVELSASAKLNDKLLLTGQTTYTDHEIVGSNSILFNRPEWVGSAALSYALRPTTAVAARVKYTGSRFDSSVPTGTVKLDSYFRVDTNVNHAITPSTKAILGIDNLFSEDYEEAVGFESLGVRVYLTLEVQW